MIYQLLQNLKLRRFRKQWRTLNSHNETVPLNIFPTEKIKVGKYTYGTLNIKTWDAMEEGLEIGSYCSIADGVIFLLGGNHRIDTLFTFPLRAKIFKTVSQEAISKGRVIIEDDVWIGANATILSGVKIGKGSVIGAGTVISKAIDPFSIVVGNPCRVIKKRFNDDVIEYLKHIDYTKLDFFKIRNAEELYAEIVTLEDAKQLVAKVSS